MSTIFALSSGALPSAIAVFRVSGPQSLSVLRQISKRQQWEPKKLEFTRIYDKRKNFLIDEAMAVWLPGPRTFTGEDSSELFVHGSKAVVKVLAQTLASIDGVREAKRGEFTRRAFHNGKMSISQVKGLDRLIRSQSEKERKAAFGQMRGGGRAIELRKKLELILARLFIIMDFGEHVEMQLEQARKEVAEIVLELDRMILAWQGAELAERGVDVVLYGRPNSGKSSLVNQLAHDDVAIVSEVPGTTRDSLTTVVQIGGVRCRLTDTAGIRSRCDDVIELEGMRRARGKLQAADVIVLVTDPFMEHAELEKMLEDVKSTKRGEARLILARNKSDLKNSTWPKISIPTVSTCATSSRGIATLRAALEDVIEELCPEATFLLDASLLESCRHSLSQCSDQNDAALMCQHLETCLELLAELTEPTVSESVLDTIFSKFCIGK